MELEKSRTAAFWGWPLFDLAGDVEDRTVGLDHDDLGVGVDLVVLAKPLIRRLAIGGLEANAAGVAVRDDGHDDVVDRLLEPNPAGADVLHRVVRHCHDALASLVRRPGNHDGEVVAGQQVGGLANGATFVGLVVAVVVDAIVAGFRGILVDPETIDFAIGILIECGVIAVAALERIALGNFRTDAHGGHFLRQAVAVLVGVDVEHFGQVLVGLVVAVVVDAVADLHGELVDALIGLVTVEVVRRTVAVAIQISVDLLGGLGGRGRGRRVDIGSRRGVGRATLRHFVIGSIKDTTAAFAGVESQDREGQHEDLAETVHRNSFPLREVSSCLTEHSARLDSTLPAGRFFVETPGTAEAFETPTNVSLGSDTRNTSIYHLRHLIHSNAHL